MSCCALLIAACLAAAPTSSRAPVKPEVRVTLDLKAAKVRDVLTGLGKKGRVNVVMADDVQGEVTLVVRNVAWDVALREVLRAKGLESRREGNVVWVARAAEVKAERQQLFSDTWCTEETELPSDTFCKAPER